MKFVVQQLYIGAPPATEVSREEYEALRAARVVLFAAFELEENFDLLLGNYLELEGTALQFSTESLVRNPLDYRDFFAVRAVMNRRAVNFLTAARLFVDQLPQKVSACGADASHIKRELSVHYDNEFPYRFMEALRNYVQHSGSAVHNAGIGSRWLPEGARERLEQCLKVSTLRRFLEGSKFKASVLKECPEEIDFQQSARVYLECLGKVMESARKSVEPNVQSARDCVQTIIDMYKRTHPEGSLGLAAFPIPSSEDLSVVPVFLEWDDVRVWLSKRSASMTNLRKRYVSSAPG